MNLRLSIGVFACGVCLVGVRASGADVPPAAPYPVWWNKAEFPEITTIADCAVQWSTWRPKSAWDIDYLTVPMLMPSGSFIEAATCAEWYEYMKYGGYAFSTFAITMESWFMFRALGYTTIPHLQPSPRSGFADKPWSEYAAHFLNEDDLWVYEGKVERQSGRVAYDGWYAKFQCDGADCLHFDGATLVARGDYDGDEWEDMIVSTFRYAAQGSGRSFERRMFTRRESGRIIETSNRLFDRPVSPAMMTERRARLAQSFDVPEGVPITLTGSMEVETGVPSPITMILKFEDGFAIGSYSFDGDGKSIPVEGSMGFDRTIELSEFALGEQKSAEFLLDFQFDQKLALDGLWCSNRDGNKVRLTSSVKDPVPPMRSEMPPPFPVKIDPEWSTRATTQAEWDQLWETASPVPEGCDLEMTFEMTPGDSNSRLATRMCRTGPEWLQTKAEGGYGRTTYAMAMEGNAGHFLQMCRVLPKLRASARSNFVDVDLIKNRTMFTPFEGTLSDDSTPDFIRIDTDGYGSQALSITARGDFDGDGLEDLLGTRSECRGGSHVDGWTTLLARRESGRIIDISCRMWDVEELTQASLDADRTRWADSCGIPEGVEFELRGSGLSMRVRLTDGYITGTCTTDESGQAVPIEGCLGNKQCGHFDLLRDGSAGGTTSASVGGSSFDWSYAEGVLTLKGEECSEPYPCALGVSEWVVRGRGN